MFSRQFIDLFACHITLPRVMPRKEVSVCCFFCFDKDPSMVASREGSGTRDGPGQQLGGSLGLETERFMGVFVS